MRKYRPEIWTIGAIILLIVLLVDSLSAQQLKQIQKGTARNQIPVTNGTQFTQVYRDILPYLLDTLSFADSIPCCVKVKNSPTMTLRIQNDSIRADIKKRLNAINVGGQGVFLALNVDSTGQIIGVSEIISDDFDKDEFNELQSISLLDSINRVFRLQLSDGGIVKWKDQVGLPDSIFMQNDTIRLRDGSGFVRKNKFFKQFLQPDSWLSKDGDMWYNYTNEAVYIYNEPSNAWVMVKDTDDDPNNEQHSIFFYSGGKAPTGEIEGDFLVNNATNYYQYWDSIGWVNLFPINITTDTALISQIISDSLALITTEPDSIQRIGNVISLRDGDGSVDLSDLVNPADSTGFVAGYGMNAVEIDNIIYAEADTSQVTTPYDLTLKQDLLTGANKRIPYFTGTSTLGNSDNLVFDNATKYLGIGTASPDATLHMTQATGNRIRFTDPSAGTNYKNWQIFAGSGADERNLSFQSLSDAGTEYNFMTWRKGPSSQVVSNLYIPHLATSSGTEVLTMNTVGEVWKSELKTVGGSSLFGSGNIGIENPLTFSAPLSRSTNTISIPAASTSVSGHLTSTDWNTFDGYTKMVNTNSDWNTEFHTNRFRPIFGNGNTPNGLFGYGFWSGHQSTASNGMQLAVTGSASSPPALYFRTRDSGTFQSWARAVTITGNTQYYIPRVDVNGNLELATTLENGLYLQTGKDLVVDKSMPNIRLIRSGSNHIIMGDEQGIWGTNAGSFSMFVYGNNSFNIATNSGKRLNINGSGTVNLSSLAGSGTRMVTATSTGDLGTAAIPVNTDAQTLSFSSPNLSISGGNSVALPVLPSGSSTNTLRHNGSSWEATSLLATGTARVDINAWGGSVNSGTRLLVNGGIQYTSSGFAATTIAGKDAQGGITDATIGAGMSLSSGSLVALSSQVIQVSKTTATTNSTAGNQVVEFSSADVNLGSALSFDDAGDYISVTNAGTYEVTFSGLARNTVAGSDIWFEAWNGSSWGTIGGFTADSKIYSTTSAPVHFSRLVTLIANGRVRVRYNIGGGTTVVMDFVRLIVKRIV